MKTMKVMVFAATLFAAWSSAAFAQDGGNTVLNPNAFNRIEHRLNLTPQQREQARAILQQERPALQQMRINLAAERKEMAETSVNGVFDPAAAHAVAVKYADVNANVAVERAKVLAELRAILTTEQQAQLQQLRARIGAFLDVTAADAGDTR